MIKTVIKVQEQQSTEGTPFWKIRFDSEEVGTSLDPRFKDSVGKSFDVTITPNGQNNNITINSEDKLKSGVRKVSSVIEKVNTSGNPYFIVTFSDGVVASFYDVLLRDSAGKEFNVELTQKGQYINGKIVKENKGFPGKQFVPKSTKEIALGFAVQLHAPASSAPDVVLKSAEVFNKWLKE